MFRPVIYIFIWFIYYIVMHGTQLEQPLQVYLHSLIDHVQISIDFLPHFLIQENMGMNIKANVAMCTKVILLLCYN